MLNTFSRPVIKTLYNKTNQYINNDLFRYHSPMIETGALLDIIRLLTGIILLSYASYTDIKTRLAANILWLIMGITGAILLAVQWLTIGIQNPYYLIFIPIMIALMYGAFQLRLIYGGADAKALMALAILVPFQPHIDIIPLWGQSLFPGSLTIFLNASIMFLFIPITLLIYNILKRDIAFPHCLLGYTMTIEKAQQTFIWPLEKIDDEGKRRFAYLPKNFDVDEELKVFEEHGINQIWVTPKIPYMIPLLIGFIITFVLGDILFLLMQWFI